jgi:hypothetical protein
MFDPTPNPGGASLEDRMRNLSRHITTGTARLLDLIAEFDLVRGWARYGFRSCADWLTHECGFSPSTARERVRVARALVSLPLIKAAFARGDISYSKCRMVTRVATPETDDFYLEMALEYTAAELERDLAVRRKPRKDDADDCPDGTVTWRVLRNGKIEVKAILTPDQFETVMAGLSSAHEGLLAEDAKRDATEESTASDERAAPAEHRTPGRDAADPAPRADREGRAEEPGEDAHAGASPRRPSVLWVTGDRSGRVGTEVLVAMARSQLRAVRTQAGEAVAEGEGASADVAA